MREEFTDPIEVYRVFVQVCWMMVYEACEKFRASMEFYGDFILSWEMDHYEW